MREHRHWLARNARRDIHQACVGRASAAGVVGPTSTPGASARYAFAAIESSADFTVRWPQVASRLGIRSRDRIDVLADGARWIWDGVELHWANADGALDVFHALEHVAQTAQALYGEGSQPAQRWNDRARDTLLAHGWPGMSRLINESRVDAVRAPQREAVAALERYLTPHADRLRYAQRLAEGRAIGSGLVEAPANNWSAAA